MVHHGTTRSPQSCKKRPQNQKVCANTLFRRRRIASTTERQPGIVTANYYICSGIVIFRYFIFSGIVIAKYFNNSGILIAK